MNEAELDDEPEIELVEKIIRDWFGDVLAATTDDEDLTDCAGQIVLDLRRYWTEEEPLRLRPENSVSPPASDL